MIGDSCVISALPVQSVQSALYVSSVQWMMGKAVQCDVWCEIQYDGEVTSCGSRTKGHELDL